MQVRSASAKAFTARAPCVARVSIRAAHSRGALRVQAIKVGDMLPAFELETDASTAQNKVTVKSQVRLHIAMLILDYMTSCHAWPSAAEAEESSLPLWVGPTDCGTIARVHWRTLPRCTFLQPATIMH